MVAKHANLVFFHDGSIVWFHDKLSMPSIPNGDHVSQQHNFNGYLLVNAIATVKVVMVKDGGGVEVTLLHD